MNDLEFPYSKVNLHPREGERIKALHELQLLDTFPEKDYDELTKIAAQICGTKVSFINLIDKDRQWSKSAHGSEINETPRELAFCSHTILEMDSVMIVEDTQLDERFMDHPYVRDYPNIRFYAGAKLQTESQLPLGALCVVDTKPRQLTKQQSEAMEALANQVVQLMNLRKKSLDYERTILELRNKNELLGRFAHVAAHDIKSPLNNIFSLSRLFENKYKSQLDTEGISILNLIKVAAENLRNLINGLLEYSTSEQLVNSHKSRFEAVGLFRDIRKYFSGQGKLELSWETGVKDLYTNRTVLEQILLNLVSNAIKHGGKHPIQVAIKLEEKEDFYRFTVSDNGQGIAREHRKEAFEIFKSFADPGSDGDRSYGIGLATVKKLIDLSGGKVAFGEKEGPGTSINFTLRKV